jgi:hypothetical protein
MIFTGRFGYGACAITADEASAITQSARPSMRTARSIASTEGRMLRVPDRRKRRGILTRGHQAKTHRARRAIL